MMKNLKAVAVVVGSLALAGVTAPAVAADKPGNGLVDNGKTVARNLPAAAKAPTGMVGGKVKRTAEGVKQGVQESGMVKTPVFGGALPNPLDGKLLNGLPVGKTAAKPATK
ncbi:MULTISPECIES: hypothetical protein [unclassified Streptomyces]|uniref:hypothetical protein n=1 Tax=unclassified Streptomyces TaxID=2593676 RepID=UPI003415F9E6